jgi:hypothetical protein
MLPKPVNMVALWLSGNHIGYSTLHFHGLAALQRILKPEHIRQPVHRTIRLCYASLAVPYSV